MFSAFIGPLSQIKLEFPDVSSIETKDFFYFIRILSPSSHFFYSWAYCRSTHYPPFRWSLQSICLWEICLTSCWDCNFLCSSQTSSCLLCGMLPSGVTISASKRGWPESTRSHSQHCRQVELSTTKVPKFRDWPFLLYGERHSHCMKTMGKLCTAWRQNLKPKERIVCMELDISKELTLLTFVGMHTSFKANLTRLGPMVVRHATPVMCIGWSDCVASLYNRVIPGGCNYSTAHAFCSFQYL
jgi:hypothetical protein